VFKLEQYKWNKTAFIVDVEISGLPRGGLKPFRNFAKAEPNSQFCGIYICKNLIRIWVSFICKLSGTPDKGATAPKSPFSLPLHPQLNVLNFPLPEKKFLV
jgi:hypothetical protein